MIDGEQNRSHSGPERRNCAPGSTQSTAGSADPVRVLLVDDHELIRHGLASLLEGEPGIDVVGRAGDGLEAIELTGQLKPDVVLMDVSLPKLNGLDATRILHVRHPAVRIIGLSMHYELAGKMLAAGASDYLLKTSPCDVLMRAIRASPHDEPPPGLPL